MVYKATSFVQIVFANALWIKSLNGINSHCQALLLTLMAAELAPSWLTSHWPRVPFGDRTPAQGPVIRQ